MKYNNDILIRNIDASYLYWKIKDDEVIAEYESKKKELANTEEKNPELQNRVETLSKQIFSFKSEIELPNKDNRYLYSGTLTDSLMSRKIRRMVKRIRMER